MEMDSYKSRILDGVLMVLVQKRNCTNTPNARVGALIGSGNRKDYTVAVICRPEA